MADDIKHDNSSKQHSFFKRVLLLFNVKKVKSNKDIISFAICLVIATSFWFLNALSKSYTTTVTYPTSYINLPKDRIFIKQPPEQITLRVEAYGFTLFRDNLSFTLNPVVIDVSKIIAQQDEGDDKLQYTISTESLFDNISKQIDSEIRLLEVPKQVISLALDKIIEREVTIVPDINAMLESQTVFIKDPYTVPKSVTISGAKAVVDSIESILTTTQNYKNLSESMIRNVKLKIPEEVRVSQSRVVLHLEVEKFTENTLSVPVQVVGVPDSISVITFPNTVNITYRVGVSSFRNITEDNFVLSVNWSSDLDGENKLPINAVSLSDKVISFRISPTEVEFAVKE